MSNPYLGAPSSESNAEAVRTIQSEDFTMFTTITPGNYINPSRSVTIEDREDGNYTAVLTMDGGFVNEDGKTFSAGKYPLKKWISTVAFKAKTRDGAELPGTTSSVAEYLRAVGVNPKGLTLDEAKEHLLASATTPVGLYIGRTDKGVKNPETGKYESVGLKTKDFNLGSKEEPVWAEQIERDGRVFRAAPRITSFRRIA